MPLNEEKLESWITILIGQMKSNRAKFVRYMNVVQVLLGGFLLFMGHYMGHEHLHLIREGVRTQGRVVGHEEATFRSSTGIGGTTTAFMPIVEFRLSDRTIRFTDWLGSSSTGDLPNQVTVLYDPVHPTMAMIDRDIMNWIPWAPIGAVGLFLIFVGLKGWLVSRPQPLAATGTLEQTKQ